MANNKELAVIEKKSLPTIDQLQKLEIKDTKTMTKAAGYLSDLKATLKKVEDYRKAKTDPLNKVLKAIRDETRPIEERLNAAITDTAKKMSKYQTAAQAVVDDKANKIVDRIGEGRGKLKTETAVEQLENLERPDKAIATEAGVVKFKPVAKVDITPVLEMSEAQLLQMQNQFLILAQEGLIVWDDVKVRKLILGTKDSAQLPGVIYRIEQVPVNFGQ